VVVNHLYLIARPRVNSPKTLIADL